MKAIQAFLSSGNVADVPTKTPGRKELSPQVAKRVRSLIQSLYVDRFRKNKTSLGRALGISQPAVTRILDGGGISRSTAVNAARVAKVDPIPLLGEDYGMATTSSITRLYPNLEACLAYHVDRWTGPVIAAARTGAFPGPDVSPTEWAKRLDTLSEAMKTAVRKGE